MKPLAAPPKLKADPWRWRSWVHDVLRGRAMHHIVWDDVYPSSVSVGSRANAPSFTAYSGNLAAYEFVGTGPTLKELGIEFQFPHARKDGTDVVPHLHLYIPDDATGGTIKFGCEYEWSNIWDTGAISTTTVYGTVTRAANAGVSQNHILSFGTFDGTDKNLSSILSCRIFRDPSDADDTFAPSVWLRSADVHAQKTWLGSFLQFARG